ncbi:MAG: hypothetical protein CL946_09750, partial [Ectothiorhodospiraceae bacterium]|nr:hypothetical protein [Ectothiorhodospiraceae bacterium]
PPPIAANINVSVRDGGEKLMRSYEQWVGGGKVWELTIEHAEEAVLQFATSGSMPQGAGLYILDLDARRALPYSGGEVRLDNRGLKERSLRVIIGSAAFAGKHSNGIDLTPREFGLAQNFPNPFREHTTISYTVAEPSHVSIEVYNRLGERVATIVDGWSEAGAFAVDWHTGSPAGRMPAGTYVLRMQAGSFSTTSNITILR